MDTPADNTPDTEGTPGAPGDTVRPSSVASAPMATESLGASKADVPSAASEVLLPEGWADVRGLGAALLMLDAAVAPLRQLVAGATFVGQTQPIAATAAGSPESAPPDTPQTVAQQRVAPRSPAAKPSDEQIDQIASWLGQQRGYRVLSELVPIPATPQTPGMALVAFLDCTMVSGVDRPKVSDVASAVVGLRSDLHCMGLVAGYNTHGNLDSLLQAARFESSLDGVALIVAHGARAIRPALEERFPFLAQKEWACSREELHWRGSSNLEFQAMRIGYYFDASRTLQRAHALSRLVCEGVVTGESKQLTVLQAIIHSSRKRSYRLYYKDFKAPRPVIDESVEAINAIGMTWDDTAGAYAIDVADADEANSVVRRLADVSHIDGELSLETIDATDRYSSRRGRVEWRRNCGTT